MVQATAAAAHPVADCPDARVHLRSLERADRLARDIERLERRIKGRTESLARQFDRVLRVLEAWGYVDGWSLTDAGERLAGLYHESDLLVAECAGQGLLDDLEPSELAALVSVFTYEAAWSRRADPSCSRPPRCACAGRRSTGWPPSSTGRRRRPACRSPAGPTRGSSAWPTDGRPESTWGRSSPTRRSPAVTSCATSSSSSTCCASCEDLASRPATAAAAREAADRLFRGVVAASSVLGS